MFGDHLHVGGAVQWGMLLEQLGDLLNHSVTITPFPHEWNKFTLRSIEGGTAVFHKGSNGQRFDVPMEHITMVRPATNGERADVVINGPVWWERDTTGYGNIWTVR
jgi:hypothetical protein